MKLLLFIISLAHLIVLTSGRSQLGYSTSDFSVPSYSANINETYRKTVGRHKEWVLQYIYSPKQMQEKALRLAVSSPTANSTNPILFVVKQQLGILSWQLPLRMEIAHYMYWTVSRTLCPVRNYKGGETVAENQTLTIDISTMSEIPVDVAVTLYYENNYFLSLNQKTLVVANPSEPVYFEMRFPDGIDMLVVSATSDDDVCSILSIQPIGCPVFDLDKNVQYVGVYQTMTKKAAIAVRRTEFTSGGFYVVVVVKPDDYDCSGLGVIRPASDFPARTKNLTLVVERKITEENYLAATIGTVVVFILFYVFSFIISVFQCIKDKRRNGDDDVSINSSLEIERGSINPGLSNSNEASYGTMSPSRRRLPPQERPMTERHVHNPFDEPAETGSDSDDDSSLDDAEIDMLPDAESDKNILRTKTFLYVSDLSLKRPKALSKKSRQYLWSTITIATFYALPVVQLVITYETVLHVTGNQDICYYNFLCTYPLGTISDFNHVFSNIGYVLLGFLFIILVWRRDVLHRHRASRNEQYEKRFGLPSHFGLFYAMGIALMMEGIMSGCYHVCPNYSNFQFDTSFMYMIAGLCMLKIYQARHPDINANAYVAFVAFAIVIFIGVVGVLYGTPIFWIAFACVHFLTCIGLSTQIYYMGRWGLNLGIFKRIYLTMKTDLLSNKHCFRPMYLDRMILLLLVNMVNWAFSIYGLIIRPTNFASYLLAIFIVNLLMYVAFYIIMKLRSKEKILPLAQIYIYLSMITWSAALFFFLQKSTTWEKTPALSRLYNKPCLILDFYDDHDVWHFLSSASMFFSFMILLTLDDDLVYTPRNQIPVF